MSEMMELNATLDFACCGCEQPVSVTVQCKGDCLGQEGGGGVAKVLVPCPSCGRVNQLLFEPGGAVRSVRPYVCYYMLPEPSVTEQRRNNREGEPPAGSAGASPSRTDD